MLSVLIINVNAKWLSLSNVYSSSNIENNENPQKILNGTYSFQSDIIEDITLSRNCPSFKTAPWLIKFTGRSYLCKKIIKNARGHFNLCCANCDQWRSPRREVLRRWWVSGSFFANRNSGTLIRKQLKRLHLDLYLMEPTKGVGKI